MINDVRLTDSINFIKTITDKANKDLVLGLSGGIDSAVALELTIKAIGPNRIRVIMLPYNENQNLEDAKYLATDRGIKFEVISIKDIVDAFNCEDNYRKANIMARVRMTILYERAMHYNSLVLGTTNLSEYYLGYFTKWGDGAVDLEPLMNMTKTKIFEAAKLLQIPDVFITKRPSADLWEGQTDEDEMGLTYAEVDKIIDKYYEQFNSINYIDSFSDYLQLEIERTSPFYDIRYNALVVLKKRYDSSQHKLSPIPQTAIRL